MTASLKIKNFKRIKNEIELKEFTRVNYFVGKNSSGKTSVLNALSFLQDGGNSKSFFNSESSVEFSINGKVQKIIWNKNNPNFTENNKEVSLLTIREKDDITPEEKGHNNVSVINQFNYEINEKSQLEYLNETLRFIDAQEIEVAVICDASDPWSKNLGTRVFKHEGIIINTRLISSGWKSFNNLKYLIDTSLKNNNLASTVEAILILIEEPENNLHPDLQKKLPNFLNAFLGRQEESIRKKIFFFISTHSPFIVSASAKNIDQKVYLFDNGYLLNVQKTTDKALEVCPVGISSGFNGHDCNWVVSQLLGSDVTDLGYPENYCILEEYSLQLILDDAKEKGIIKNIQFVSASGAIKTIGFSEAIKNIENLNTLVKCNPYYFDKYLLVIDNFQTLSPKEQERINKIKMNLGVHFIELSKSSLEEYYQDFSNDIYGKFQSEIQAMNGKDRGDSKAKYARIISVMITNKADFSRLFNGELDVLLV